MTITSFEILKIYRWDDDYGYPYYVKVRLSSGKKVHIHIGDDFPTEETIKKAVEEYIEGEKMNALHKSWIESMIGRIFKL